MAGRYALGESMAYKILVVEDSPDIGRLLRHVLSRAGYDVYMENEGPAGWNAFLQLRPDLVLLDVNLPGISGLEVCQRIKNSANTPVIVLTVQAEIEAAERGIQAGADAYLAKPFEIPKLIAAVEDLLRPRIQRLSSTKGGHVGTEDSGR
jgi:DNA-binding response OmpR family regulator